MQFKAKLWVHKPRKDGSCRIVIYGKQKYFDTGIAVFPNQWDEKNRKVARTHELHAQINASISSRIMELEKIALEGKKLPSKRDAKEQVKQNELASVANFIDAFLMEVAKGQHAITEGTAKHYRSLKLRINQFDTHQGAQTTLDKINQDWYGDFWQFLHGHFGIQKEGGFSKHIKVLKKFMNESRKRGIHNNVAHEDAAFKVHQSRGQKIYLTEQEIEKLENLDLSTLPNLEEERDRWLICYFFLLRYQDGQDHIQAHNFFESNGKQYFRYDSNKTGINATIPVKPRAMKILEKYNFKMPKTTNQQANRDIKTIASMAGINTVVVESGKKAPKCNFVRTHTARRSAATNLALQGVPLDFIAAVGGWKKLETLKKYLLASGLDIANVIRNYAFFK